MLKNTVKHGGNRDQSLNIVCMCMVHFIPSEAIAMPLKDNSIKMFADTVNRNESQYNRLAIAACVGELDLYQSVENQAPHVK